MSKKPAFCKFCDELGHYQYQCYKYKAAREIAKPRKTPGKKLRLQGKYHRKWQVTRWQWVELNPPNHQGYYTCHICGINVPATEMELDHVIPRSRAPELRYEFSNLKPSHHLCNTEKGSKVYEA